MLYNFGIYLWKAPKLDYHIGERPTYRRELAATSQRIEEVKADFSVMDRCVKKIEDLSSIASQLK